MHADISGEWFAPQGGVPFKGGAQSFFHNGTNGRWRDLLSTEELILYEAAAKRELTQSADGGWKTEGRAVSRYDYERSRARLRCSIGGRTPRHR
jgi:hypothetical protein